MLWECVFILAIDTSGGQALTAAQKEEYALKAKALGKVELENLGLDPAQKKAVFASKCRALTWIVR